MAQRCDAIELHQRIRVARDFLLNQEFICEQSDRLLQVQSSIKKNISKKLQVLAFKNTDEFFIDCSKLSNMIQDIPSLKNQFNSFIKLTKKMIGEDNNNNFESCNNKQSSHLIGKYQQLENLISNAKDTKEDENLQSMLCVFDHTTQCFIQSTRLKPVISEGSKIEGNNRGRGKWYPGVVTRLNRNGNETGTGSADVSYEDGEKEKDMSMDMLRLLPSNQYIKTDEETQRIIRVLQGNNNIQTDSKHNMDSNKKLEKRYNDVGGLSLSRSLQRFQPSTSPLHNDRTNLKIRSDHDAKKSKEENTQVQFIPQLLIGVKSESEQKIYLNNDDEEGPVGCYTAEIVVCDRKILLGQMSTPAEAARAYDRASIRAYGPEQLSVDQLNFPIITYSKDSMDILTKYDDILKSNLFGTNWKGLQECDFAFVITNARKRGRDEGKSASTSTSKSLSSSISVNISTNIKKKKTKVVENSNAINNMNMNAGLLVSKKIGRISIDSLAPYDLPKIDTLISDANEDASSAVNSTGRPKRVSGRSKYRSFDRFDPTEAALCSDIPALHCYIIAQELKIITSSFDSFKVFTPNVPNDIDWTIYAQPYVLPERMGIQSIREKAPRYTPWISCLPKTKKVDDALILLQNNIRNSVQMLQSSNKPNDNELFGVYQLSTEHSVFIASLPENVIDPLSRLSGDKNADIGCFSYAIEAALIREQIMNPKRQAFGSKTSKRIRSNFKDDEWEMLKNISKQLEVFLKTHLM